MGACLGRHPAQNPPIQPRQPPTERVTHSEEAADPAEEQTFLLPADVQYGYCHISSPYIEVSDSGLSAAKITLGGQATVVAFGVVYGERPLQGTAEFEVEIVEHWPNPNVWGSLKLGVARCKTGTKPSDAGMPEDSLCAVTHCVWSSDRLHNGLYDRSFRAQPYGLVNLDKLRTGDRVGMRVTHEGILEFFVNGASQGVAAGDMHQRGYDLYVVVDHYGACMATKITRAAICVPNIQLQDLCLRQIVNSQMAINQLPLPVHLQNKL